MFTIEKNIKKPEAGEKRYPFGEMEVGDSFFISGGDKEAKTARSAASMYAARKGVKFSLLKSPDGYRCWRVK